ncbi:hypothetical protein J2847_006579 [Azospirillum agricola]|uniref:SPW repeat protein n=1 Tax=Azospirillum agricola TaxID=1720247 RepID=UPI001AE822D5|nr:SPW repeat protein [Azospirillum agricola]MBP2233242.1 hypothetical protein [Azospirillum agricola]
MIHATWKDRQDKGFTDVMTLLLGAGLFITPWLFRFTDLSLASWNAWTTGAVIIVLALAAIFAFAEWEKWGNLLVGLWAFAAPWALGFAGHPLAMRSHVAIGLAVTLLSAAEAWYFHRHPPRMSA